mmetsp:Transcript_3348/g.7010  ORF Transcript_3348/g.7010 Transcript_3348/m.7010 type:complete len:218 (-) Transcript_3348:181-834(-)
MSAGRRSRFWAIFERSAAMSSMRVWMSSLSCSSTTSSSTAVSAGSGLAACFSSRYEHSMRNWQKFVNSLKLITPLPSSSKTPANLRQCSRSRAHVEKPSSVSITGKSSSGVSTSLPSVSTSRNLALQLAMKFSEVNCCAMPGGRRPIFEAICDLSSRTFSISASISADSSCSPSSSAVQTSVVPPPSGTTMASAPGGTSVVVGATTTPAPSRACDSR